VCIRFLFIISKEGAGNVKHIVINVGFLLYVKKVMHIFPFGSQKRDVSDTFCIARRRSAGEFEDISF
jgi:hypothetical protein